MSSSAKHPRYKTKRKYDFDEVTSMKFPSPYSLSKNVHTIHTFGAVDPSDFLELGSTRSLLDDLPVAWSGVTTSEISMNRGPLSFTELGSIGEGLFSGRFTPEIAPTSPDSCSLSLLSPEGEISHNRRDSLHRGKFGSMKKRSALIVR